MAKTVLLLGASGKICRHSARAFTKAGWTLKKFNRKTDDIIQAAQDCDVIINGMNPANYDNWAENIPRITRDVIAAAKASGAMVVIPGNVYVFGNTPGLWSETTPHRPNTVKGRIRAEMEQAYRTAAKDGVQTLILRAGDFIDTTPTDTVMNMIVMKDVKNGKLTRLGPVNTVRAHCYLPDWARAVVELVEMRDQLAMFEDVPMPGEAFSTDDLQQALESAAGRSLKITAFPWWFMTLASPFWPLAKEFREMRYLFETDHQLCGKKLARLLPDFQPTDRSIVLTAELPVGLRKSPMQAQLA